MKQNFIKGKTVLITGASSGIGQACAEQFAKLGADLIIAARRKDRLDSLSKRLQEECSIKVLAVELDVRNKSQVEVLFNKLSQDGIMVDIVVNNAGLALSTDKIHLGSPDNWDVMIDTNLKGLLYVTRAAITAMVLRNSG